MTSENTTIRLYHIKLLSIIFLILNLIYITIIYQINYLGRSRGELWILDFLSNFFDFETISNSQIIFPISIIIFLIISFLNIRAIYYPILIIENNDITYHKNLFKTIKGYKNRWKYYYDDDEIITLYHIDSQTESKFDKLFFEPKEWNDLKEYLDKYGLRK